MPEAYDVDKLRTELARYRRLKKESLEARDEVGRQIDLARRSDKSPGEITESTATEHLPGLSNSQQKWFAAAATGADAEWRRARSERRVQADDRARATDDRGVSAAEAAEIVGVTHRSIRVWAERGWIRSNADDPLDERGRKKVLRILRWDGGESAPETREDILDPHRHYRIR